jgi:hypothetical protein
VRRQWTLLNFNGRCYLQIIILHIILVELDNATCENVPEQL